MGVEKVLSGESSEDLEDPCSARCGTGTVLGVEVKLGDPSVGHGPADHELDEGADEESDEVAGHEPLDARRVVEEHRCDELVTLQEVMAAFEAGLVLVDDEELGTERARGRW